MFFFNRTPAKRSPSKCSRDAANRSLVAVAPLDVARSIPNSRKCPPTTSTSTTTKSTPASVSRTTKALIALPDRQIPEIGSFNSNRSSSIAIAKIPPNRLDPTSRASAERRDVERRAKSRRTNSRCSRTRTHRPRTMRARSWTQTER